MTKKLDGYYTYAQDPLTSTYKIDKKYSFDSFIGKTIIAMEIPDTADIHIQRVAMPAKDNVNYWLSSEMSDCDTAVSIFDKSTISARIKSMINDNFKNVNMAVNGFILDSTIYPKYDVYKSKNILVCDFFLQKWFDFELMYDLCQKYKIPTLPILFKGTVTKEEEIKKFIGTSSQLSTTEKIKYILVRTMHENIDDTAYLRKGITLIEAPHTFNDKKTTEKEEKEEESVSILNEVLDPFEDVNEFACKEINEKEIIIPIESFTEKEISNIKNDRIDILKKKINTIFSFWFVEQVCTFKELIKQEPNLVEKGNLFNISNYFIELFIEFLENNEYKEIYVRLNKIFTEKAVRFEIGLIVTSEVKKKFFEDTEGLKVLNQHEGD